MAKKVTPVFNNQSTSDNGFLFPSTSFQDVDLSKYEQYLGNDSGLIEGDIDTELWNEQRARAQSGGAKVLNSIGQGVGTFGTALASSVAALGSGAVALGAETADLFMEGDQVNGMDVFLNNPVMRGVNDFDKFLKEDLMPTYYTKEQQDSFFSASTGTDLLNGLGFMMSAVVPAGAINKMFGGMSKLASVAKAGKLPAILKLAEEAGRLTKIESALISKTARYLDKAGPIVGGVVGRIGESAMEANQTYEQIKESLTAERDQAIQDMATYGETDNMYALKLTDAEIENKAKTGRNNDFGGNMMLTFSDISQNTRWFRGGGIGDRLIKDGFRTTVKELTKKGIVGSFIKESIQEAGEEGFQFLLSKGAENQAKYGKSFLSGIEDASGDLFTTIEGIKSMGLGAILGGGMSSFAAAKNSKKLKEQLNAIAQQQTLNADVSQRYITDPITGKKIVNPELSKVATTFAFYEQQKDKAAAEGDQDAYDVAEKMQFSHLVSSKIAADQFDDFVDQLQDLGMSSTEEMEAMFGELPIKNGKKMTPAEVAFDKIQLAKRVKNLDEGLQKLPGMEKLGPNGMTMAKHMLFTQESLRDQIKEKDQQIATVQASAVYNPIPVENSDLFEQEDNLLPQDRLKLTELQAEREDLVKNYKEISDVFKAIVAKPEIAQEQADATQEANISNAVNTLITDLKQEGQDLANAVGQTIVVEDAEGNEVEVVVATDEDGNFVNENTGEILPNEVVLEQTAVPEEEVAEEDLPEFDEEVITIDEENVIDEYQKKLTVNATAGQALQLDGGNYVIENGERVENPKFVEQTKIFNDPTISNNVVENPEDQPNAITFKAELGTITETELSDTNARRKSKGLEPITIEQAQNDSDFVPIVLTLMVNGVAKNTAKSFYHNPEYYYSTAEYQMIEDNDISEKVKKETHEKNIAKHKATRADLVQQLKDKKSVVLLTAGKSRGVLNYNPKVDTQRKTSNVIGILAENFKELLNGIQNKFFSVEGGKTNPINTQGLRIVTAVTVMEDGNFMISTQSNSSKSAFVSKVEYSVGTMLMDLISPSGEVVTTSPFTKARFSYEQIKSLAELVLEKLQGKNTVDVGGTLITISGTEKVPGILDSVIYVGKVKSSDADAINSQLYFTKDGRLVLGNKPYDKNTEGIYDIIEKHISQYKARPHFKFKSIEIFGSNFGIPVKQGNGTFKIENPVDYMEFMFGSKKTPALITTALNPTKFVNSYFKFATNNNGDLSIKGQIAKAGSVGKNWTPPSQSDNINTFPLLKGADVVRYIPESVAQKAWEVWNKEYQTEQSLQRTKERGGFGINEMDMFYPNWREESNKINEQSLKETPKAEPIITEPVSDIEAKADIERKRQETNNKFEELEKQIDAINYDEVADSANLINKLVKNIPLPANTRINNWILEELNGKLWESKKNLKGKEEEFFGKENWDKIKEAKKQFNIEFKKIEDSNLSKINLIEQKQSDLLNTIDGLELRKAWSFGLIEEPNMVGLDETNFITKETEVKNGDFVETDNYEGYYYLSASNEDGDFYEVILGKTKQEVEDIINAKYDAELSALKGKPEVVDNKVEIEKLEEEIENLEQNKEQALSEKFKGIDISQKTIDIISERGDKKAIAFIEKYDAFNYEYDSKIEQLKEKVLDLKSKAKEVVEEMPNKAANDAVTEKVNDCKGVEAPPEIKTTPESSNISKAADNYSWE